MPPGPLGLNTALHEYSSPLSFPAADQLYHVVSGSAPLLGWPFHSLFILVFYNCYHIRLFDASSLSPFGHHDHWLAPTHPHESPYAIPHFPHLSLQFTIVELYVTAVILPAQNNTENKGTIPRSTSFMEAETTQQARRYWRSPFPLTINLWIGCVL